MKNAFLRPVRMAGLCLVLLLASLSAQALPQLGVYRWAAVPSGPANVDNYSLWLNQPDMWAEDFEASDTWANIAGPGWILNPWSAWVAARPGRTLILSVPMLPSISGVSLETGATGAYNGYYQTLAQNLVAKNLGNTIIRLGWEFNGGWYKWAAKGKTAAFAAYWQQIVTTMRAVPGTQNLKFCFNPVYGYQQFPAEQAYPGDAYVDYIALDVYDECWATNTYPLPADATDEEIATRRQNAWNELHTGNRGLAFWKSFATQHGKPFAIAEWGVNKRSDGHGGLDNPQFVANMHTFMVNNNVAWAVYFDVQAGDGHHQLSPITNGTDFPLARARFLELFSGTGATLILDNTDASGVTITGSWTASTFTTGYHGADYLHDGNTGKGGKSVRFTPTIPTSGRYDVFTRWTSETNRASNVPIDIVSAAGTTTVSVDQRVNGGKWVSLGAYDFAAGTGGSVLIRTTGTNGNVIADAVGFVGTGSSEIVSPAKIINSYTSKALRPYAAGTGNDVNIVQYTYDPTWTSQRWQITDLGNTYYSILNVYTGKSLRPLNASTSPGANIVQYTHDSSWQSEQWELIPNGAGYYGIRNRYSGLALRPADAATGDNVQIKQETYDSSFSSMKWLIAAP